MKMLKEYMSWDEWFEWFKVELVKNQFKNVTEAYELKPDGKIRSYFDNHIDAHIAAYAYSVEDVPNRLFWFKHS